MELQSYASERRRNLDVTARTRSELGFHIPAASVRRNFSNLGKEYFWKKSFFKIIVITSDIQINILTFGVSVIRFHVNESP